MATFPTITLNGNTTTTWTNQGGGITNHEVFAFTLQNTSPANTTGVLLSNVTVSSLKKLEIKELKTEIKEFNGLSEAARPGQRDRKLAESGTDS